MNEDNLRDRLRELGIRRISRSEAHACEGSDVALEEGTRLLMKKIRGPYIFGGPLFERSRTEEQLIRILQSLGIASSESEGRKAVCLMTTQELPYSHDRHDNMIFHLSLDERGRYISNLRHISQAHQGCERLYSGGDYC